MRATSTTPTTHNNTPKQKTKQKQPKKVAAHRGRLECAKALLRAGADANFVSPGGDLTLFWAIDGGADMIQLFASHGADLDAASLRGWTALSYAAAKGKYGATEEAGVYPEDVSSL